MKLQEWIRSVFALATLVGLVLFSLCLSNERCYSEWATVALLGWSTIVALVVLIGPTSIRLGAGGNELALRRERERIDSGLNQLRQVVPALARVVAHGVAGANRIAGGDLVCRMNEHASGIREAMKAAGAPEKEQNEVVEIIARMIRRDLVTSTLKRARVLAEREQDASTHDELIYLIDRLGDRFRWLATSQELDEFEAELKRIKFADDTEVASALGRLRDYMKSGKLVPAS